MKLFNRSYKLTLYRPDGRPLAAPGAPRRETKVGAFTETLTNGIEITGQRITVQIEKTIKAEPNTCEIVIYNLADNTRNLFQTSPLTMIVEAGYDGVLRHLFQGNVKYASSALKEVNWETKIQLADGGRAINNAFASKSYKAGTPVKTLLREAASTMGLRLPPEIEKDATLNERIPKGAVLDGFLRDELTRILTPYGYSWSIQSGQLQILKDTQVRETEAWVINEKDAGLVGTPEYGTPDKKKKTVTMTFSCLLFPELVPGSKIEMQSRSVNGLHRLQKVNHSLDSQEGDWNTVCEARAL